MALQAHSQHGREGVAKRVAMVVEVMAVATTTSGATTTTIGALITGQIKHPVVTVRVDEMLMVEEASFSLLWAE
ncbi:hypothetical protein CRG98_029779 [Punica granatum]|uniref:Uncharacterized protein n=1 Tax=Punica granatum TaxID=22663 RepID=A0A2I0J0S9_PUNGR|nr:hypothetical protein CRG98_029779 [Punica granatum]